MQLDALARQLREKVETIGEDGMIRMIDEGLASFVMIGCDDLAKAVASAQTVTLPTEAHSIEEIGHRNKPRRTRKGKR